MENASIGQILHAFRWNAVGRVSAQLISWVITIFVMRLLTPVDYGLAGMAAIAMGLCTLVNDLGAIPALIQRRIIDDDLVKKIFGFVIATNIFVYTALYVFAPYVAGFFSDSRLIEILRIMGLGLIVQALGSVPGALLRREMQFKAVSVVDFFSTFIGSVLTLIFAYRGMGVWSLVYGGLARGAANAIVVALVGRFHILPNFNFSGLGSTLSFGMKVSGSSIVYYFNSNVDGVLIGRLLGEHALGLYAVARNLALMPASKVMQLTNQVAFSAYSRIQDDYVRVRKYFLESARISSFIFFPVCWGMSSVSTDLVNVLLGEKWHEGAVVLQILALVIPYRALVLLLDPLVTGIGAPGVSLKNTLTTALIVPAALVVGIQWGLLGISIAVVIGTTCATTINLRRSFAFLDMRYGDMFSVLWPAVAASSIMYVAVFTAKGVFYYLPDVARLLSEVAVGAFVYVLISMMINRSAFLRVFQVVGGRV